MSKEKIIEYITEMMQYGEASFTEWLAGDGSRYVLTLTVIPLMSEDDIREDDLDLDEFHSTPDCFEQPQ